MNISPSVELQTLLNEKTLGLENQRSKRIEGLLLRSHTNWHENGDKCSQYFYKLEKKNYEKDNNRVD